MADLSQFEYAVLLRCCEFDTCLSEILESSRRAMPQAEEKVRVAAILETLKKFFDADLVVPFSRYADTFPPWTGTTSEKIDRIRTGWESLREDPRPGEVVWLLGTAKGKSLANALFEERGASPF